MPDDQAQTILAPVQADNSVKADAWQAFKDSANEREYGVRLQGMNLPQDVKAQLWEAKRSAGSPSPTQALGLPDAATQAHQQMASGQTTGLNKFDTFQNPSNSYLSMSPTGIATSPLIPAKTQAATIGAGLGGEAMAGVGAAARVPTALRMLGTASGAGFGAGAGTLAAGGSPKEALGTAAGTTAATMAAEPIAPLLKWMGASKTAGAAALQQASAKAGSAPVELSAQTDELVDKLVEQSKLGGKPIKVISDLLERLGPSTKQSPEAVPGPLTYNEARILQGNISSLSAEEQMGLKGVQKGLMKQLANSFSQDVQAAADKAGVGEEHAFGMKEFATASARNRALIRGAKIAATGAGIYGAEQLARKGVQNLIK